MQQDPKIELLRLLQEELRQRDEDMAATLAQTKAMIEQLKASSKEPMLGASTINSQSDLAYNTKAFLPLPQAMSP